MMLYVKVMIRQCCFYSLTEQKPACICVTMFLYNAQRNGEYLGNVYDKLE